MQNMPVALVTGANKGIGHEIAKQLAARGYTVLVGARDLARGEDSAKRITGETRAVALDVTNEGSIAAAASRIRREFGRLDVLVNNAGIAKGGAQTAAMLADIAQSGAPSVATLADVRAVFETNVFGVIAVTQAMLPLLREAPAGRIVNVSSRVGSMTTISDPAYPHRGIGGVAYGPSKSALNAVTIAFAQELADTAIKVNAACPGYTATDLNNHSGPRSVVEAAREPVRLALLGPDGPTGTFSNDAGPIPW
ncbi:SDR family oxidoreductase [Polyangium mundeleinium]|uniref:SDR family oxidoreductase n=1 Tax=Polyangium mundeleinium TaxID=2995306 RepID=A0ABT5F211_9BACT|nr:SDR family oxidoreductase [Polyangium mundeleinium]MDC0748036.1 SDR family oxidoreductase [Polyangium mundeleinium]